MAWFRCPRCSAQVDAPDPGSLRCPQCGFSESTTAPSFQPAGFVPGQGPATAPLPTAGIMHGGGPTCPRCMSTHTQRGGIPTWAVITAIVGFFLVCFFSLFFLMAKDDNICLNCGMRWRP